MQKLIIGLVLGAAIGVGVGYALFNKKAEEPKTTKTTKNVAKERGEWPDVACPPQQTEMPGIMASQRLAEIIALSPPPEVVQLAMDCWMEVHTPETWPPRSEQVFRAWTAANATPPNWAAVTNELEPPR